MGEDEHPRKEWGKLSLEEINQVKREQCAKCKYFSRKHGGNNSQTVEITSRTCDYFFVIGHCRLCDPRDCVKEGKFVPREIKRRVKKK